MRLGNLFEKAFIGLLFGGAGVIALLSVIFTLIAFAWAGGLIWEVVHR